MGLLRDYLNNQYMGGSALPVQPQQPTVSPPTYPDNGLQALTQTSPVPQQQPQGSGFFQMGGKRVSLADIAGKNDPFNGRTGGTVNLASFGSAPTASLDPNVQREYENMLAHNGQQQGDRAGMPEGLTLQEFTQKYGQGKDPGAMMQYYQAQIPHAINAGYLQRKLSEPSELEMMDTRFQQRMALADMQNQSSLEKALAVQDARNQGMLAGITARGGGGPNLRKGERLSASGEAELIPGSDLYIKNSRLHGKDVAAIKGLDTYTANAISKINSIVKSPSFSSLFGGYNAYLTNKMPGETQNVKAKLESLKSDLKKAGLEIMRSGGSVGMMTEREWPIVEQLIATLDPKMSEKAAKDTLGQIQSYLGSIRKNASDTYDETWSGTQFYRNRGQGGSPPTNPKFDTSKPVNNGKMNGYRQPDGTKIMAGQWTDGHIQQSAVLNDMKKQDWWKGGKSVPSTPSSQPIEPPNRTFGEIAKGWIRPAIEGTGAGIGAAVGGLAGAPTGPGAALTTVAGGALGYGMGAQLADIILGDRPTKNLKDETKQSLSDLATGATYEMGGQLAGAAVVPVTKAALKYGRHPVQAVRGDLERFVLRGAGREIDAATTQSGPVAAQAAKNAAETSALEKRIGRGWKVGLGQASGDPKLLALQRRLQMNVDTAKALNTENVMQSNQALRDYLDKTLKGGGTVDDVISALEKQGISVGNQAQALSRNAEMTAGSLVGQSKEAAGSTLREGADTVKSVLRGKAQDLYSKVPSDMQIDSTPLYRTIQEMGGDFDPAFQRLSATPTGTMNRARNALEPEPSTILGADGLPYNSPRMQMDIPERMTFKQIQDFRSQVTQAERAAKASGDFDLARKYGQLRKGVDDTLTLAEQTGQGEGVQALRDANRFYREQYVPTVRQGATSRVLAKDRTGATRVENALVGNEYFKPGSKGVAAADSFNRTFGNDAAAREAIKDHAANDLLNYARNPLTGEINSGKVAAWLNKHKDAIDRLNLGNEFSDVQIAAQAAEKARGMETQFTKSRFGKVLQSDPDKAMEYLFSGDNVRNSVKTMDDLVKFTRSDPAARQGLKRAFADMMMKKMETHAQDMAGKRMLGAAKGQDLLRKFEPAMRKLYSPDEMQAIKDVHRAIEIGNRINKSVSGVAGSQTTDLFATAHKAASNYLPLGPKFRVARALFSGLKGKYQSEVNEYVAKAMYDPALAKQLVDLANLAKTKGVDIAAKQLKRNVGIALSSTAIASKQSED